jgi:hypothetical protein
MPFVCNNFPADIITFYIKIIINWLFKFKAMKKLLTIISLLLLFYANAECLVLYSGDDSGTGGGSPAASYASSPGVINVVGISAAFSSMVASNDWNPGQLEELSSEYEACALKRATLEEANQTAINIPTDQYNSTLALLSNIMHVIWETMQSIVRNIF